MHDPAVGELRHRPRSLLALQKRDADRHLAGDLDTGEADLAVAHRRVHVADRQHPARLADREVDGCAGSVQMVVEVPAVLAGVAVRQRLAAGRAADHSDHRAKWERDAVGHVDRVALDAEDLCERRADLLDQLAHPGDEGREASLVRSHLEELDDERVAGLGAADRDRARGAVDAFEVDLRDEIGLRPDLPGEAVVRLERDHLARLDLEHGVDVRAERPDRLVDRPIAIEPVAG